jgi:inosine-uridine nucleoside N-ribohydrolase
MKSQPLQTFASAVGLLLTAAFLVTGSCPETRAAVKPVPIIFDTDIGPDVDDAGTVAILNALADRGEARILAMNCCTSSEWGAPCLDAINTYYGRPDVPIGTFKGTGFLMDAKYNRALAEQFPNDLKNGQNAPDATEVYRQVLARQPDHSVTVCAVGPLNNLARLLESGPDKHSKRTGQDLVARKVARLVIMGGRYPEGKEWNFEQAPAAAAKVMAEWPSPILASGFEIGARVHTGKRLEAETPETNPVRKAFALYAGAGKGRESWDETALYAAVRSPETLWDVKSGGGITINTATSVNGWTATSNGKHAFLVERQPVAEVEKAIEDLMVQPPRRGRK